MVFNENGNGSSDQCTSRAMILEDTEDRTGDSNNDIVDSGEAATRGHSGEHGDGVSSKFHRQL